MGIGKKRDKEMTYWCLEVVHDRLVHGMCHGMDGPRDGLPGAEH